MKRLQNTLYVTTPEAYLSLDGATVVVRNDDDVLGRVPLHNLEAIVSFGYRGVSPALMRACTERNIGLCFLPPRPLSRPRFRSCAGQCPAADRTISHRR